MTQTDTNPRDWESEKRNAEDNLKRFSPYDVEYECAETVLELIAEVTELRLQRDGDKQNLGDWQRECDTLKSQRDEMAEALIGSMISAQNALDNRDSTAAYNILWAAIRRARSSLNKTEKTDD